MAKKTNSKAKAEFEESADGAALSIGGTWHLTQPFPLAEEVVPAEISKSEIRVIPMDLVEWDSSLPLFLLRVQTLCARHAINLNIAALPDKLKRLLDLIAAREKEGLAIEPRKPPSHPLARFVGRVVSACKDPVQFIGECILGVMHIATARRQFHYKAFFSEMVEAGPKAFPIIGMLSFLVGLTFAYETSIQLRRFGLQFYMIGATGTSIVREIGPLIAAILLAGRTGAAFAANIANMKLENEIAALEMIGVSPVSFLVLPRMAALLLMMPVVTLYSDLCGILGPLIISVYKLDVPVTGFLVEIQNSVSLTDVVVGLVKSFFFAVLIGLAGTLRGLQSEPSSAGLGRAVTAAVVTGIASILATDALFSPILNHLGY
ncbi:MAG TPA: ABC transporter permease [Candidatus Sulfotelmatobacter sp.]|nr:ABC transporter permease [Candidatus Sulfotelmatobacter sp.]